MILHVDMDAFYASVEQRDFPELRGRPVIVGGSASGRGVVSAASYEARKFGVHSAMPTSRAIQLCPSATIIKTRVSRYVEVSRLIREIFDRYTPVVEPLSLDEAFLDVSGTTHLFGAPEEIGRRIKLEILKELELVASVGCAPNKFLAKLASDLEKPDGFTVIQPNRVMESIANLPTSRLWGVGKATMKRFEKAKLYRFRDLQVLTIEQAEQLLGSRMGAHFWRLAHGIDSRLVSNKREAKTLSHESTFHQDIEERSILLARLVELCESVAARLRARQLQGRTVTIKIRFADFSTITRSQTIDQNTSSTQRIWETAKRLLCDELPEACAAVRLIGVGVNNFDGDRAAQLELFDASGNASPTATAAPQPDAELDKATDFIRLQFGKSSLRRGSSIKPPK
ncbi:MAG: DNA polymerase IV [Aureliella sp.]